MNLERDQQIVAEFDNTSATYAKVAKKFNIAEKRVRDIFLLAQNRLHTDNLRSRQRADAFARLLALDACALKEAGCSVALIASRACTGERYVKQFLFEFK